MSSILTPVLRRPKFVALALLGYLAVAGCYLMLVRRESGAWQARRQQLVSQSPVVWVSPHGARYHQEWHHGRHLSSPISLYEATEWGYEHCAVCQPPPPARLSGPPLWVRYWPLWWAGLSCMWLIFLVMALKRPTGET